MSEPTPQSPAPPSVPPQSGVPFPPADDRTERNGSGAPGNRGPARGDGNPPIEIRRARNLYTAVAVFLVFIGVTGLLGISEAVVAFRVALNETDSALSDQISNGLITTLLVMTNVVTLMVAIGHGLTTHALDARRSWARPLGLTFSGILLGLAALNMFSGAQLLPSLFFGISGLLGISLLNRPEVREYLRPKWNGWNGPPGGFGGTGGPHGFPPPPGNPPPPPGNLPPPPASGPPSYHPNGDQQPSGSGQWSDGQAPSGSGQWSGGQAPSGSGQWSGGQAPSGSGQWSGGQAPSGSGQWSSGQAPSDNRQWPGDDHAPYGQQPDAGDRPSGDNSEQLTGVRRDPTNKENP